jgi:hypothetical protein
MVRSWQDNPREEVRNDAIRERNVRGQGIKIGNNERERERERDFIYNTRKHNML